MSEERESVRITKIDIALIVLALAAITFCLVSGYEAMTTPIGG